MKGIKMKKSLVATLSIISVSISCNIHAAGSQLESVSVNQHKQSNVVSHSDHSTFQTLKDAIWNKYLKDVQGLTELKAEYNNRALKFEDKTIHFSLEKRGVAPEGGYPLYIALHGGGQTSKEMNDSQWEAMKVYYNASVKDGIYVATRGITDNWNLHFEEESYPLYDKLIESAVLFDGVNPDRVYFLGFSAGGDGVYQVVPRMPERFAAANMSAGHHNGIAFDNLYNTPFLLQVGELDSMYKRNKVAAENYIVMNKLYEKYHGGFIHDVYIHFNGSHNSWQDNNSARLPQPIIADPVAWLQNGNRDKKMLNTNAIDWMNQYTRHSMPEKLVWDLSTDAKLRTYQAGAAMLGKDGYEVKTLAQPHQLFYWLDVSVADVYPEKGKLIVEAIKETNTIEILEASNINKFRILLNPDLLDLSKAINIKVAGKLIGVVNVKKDKEIMMRTMLERSDKNEIYDAQITLVFNAGTNNWEIA